jgi:P-type Cu2+ transporter
MNYAIDHGTSHADAACAARTHCLHCDQPLPLAFIKSRTDFCCNGCAAASALIKDWGLGAYYRRRMAPAFLQPLDHAPKAPQAETAHDQPDMDYGAFIQRNHQTCEIHLAIDGLACGACVWLIESLLSAQPDVLVARVNLTSRQLLLAWRGMPERGRELLALVGRLGFRLTPLLAAPTRASTAERDLLRRMAVAGFAAMNIMLLSVSVWSGHASGMGEATRDLMHWLSALIALPAIAYAGQPFFRSARLALKAGRTNMDVPVSVGVILAGLASLWETARHGPHAYFDGATMLLFFLLIGRYLDGRARGQARSAAERLLAMARAPISLIQPDGRTRTVFAGDATIGDIALVAPGEQVGADGVVIAGASDIDASLVTGESLPAPVRVGDRLFAGMVNLLAPLRMRITAIGHETLLADMARLMRIAEQGRAYHLPLADKVARHYTPIVHISALLAFLGWTLGGGLAWQPALFIAVSVLIITCPCALALAAPTVQAAATGRLMRQGTLLKSATALERIASVDTVVFDKTGTLTQGRLQFLSETGGEPGVPATRALEDAASLARNSRHPLARALCQAAGPGLVAEGVHEYPGLGLEWQGDGQCWRLGRLDFVLEIGDQALATQAERIERAASETGLDEGPVLWFARPAPQTETKQAGATATMMLRRFAFSDQLRPDAVETVAAFRRAGFHVALLSGDRRATTAQIAARVGIADWRAELTPVEKVQALEDWKRQGRTTMMIGDGLNDAAALAAADASASPGSGAAISQIAADAVFQSNNLANNLANNLGATFEIVRTARMARRLTLQNLTFSLAYNLLAVPIAMAGHATPLIAALAMSCSSLIVALNALRLHRDKPERPWRTMP